MSADAHRKLFEKMEKPIFDDKLKIITVTGTPLEALEDVVHIQSKLDMLYQHYEQNDLVYTLEDSQV